MHQLNKPEGQGREIKGKASATKTKKRRHFPLPSAEAELALAATGRSLSMWSSCFYCSCQLETDWVFGRVCEGTGHLLLHWDNCACCLSENKGKCVGEEQEKPCEQAAVRIRALEWKAASAAPGPQWVQQL